MAGFKPDGSIICITVLEQQETPGLGTKMAETKGLAATFVLIGSNVVISLLANEIPDKVLIPAFVVVIATFVTIVDLSMQAYVPSLYDKLGIFIPLIVVNCIDLGRAEAFACKNSILSSFIDGAGMGLGYTIQETELSSSSWHLVLSLPSDLSHSLLLVFCHLLLWVSRV